MNATTKKILLHAGIILGFLAVACIYFSPVLSGKVLPQGDVQKYESMARAQKDFHEQTGEYSTWAPNMFSGMPGYQITRSPQHSINTPLSRIATLEVMGWDRTIGVLFLYLLAFYVALVALGCSPWIAVLGALAFGLGSYNIIIVEAGHITKAHAMAMMAPILASMIMVFRKKYVWGGILFALSLGLQIALNHIQITFYTALAGIILGVVYFIYSIKDKQFKSFLVGVAVLLLGAVLALGCNIRHLMVNREYMEYTMRGGKEITVTPQDLHPDATPMTDNTTSNGLDINYAFGWSQGIGETYTLLVPGAMGGGSGEKVSEESEFYKNFRQNRAPLYWGNQPFTSGPVYFGAIVCFLFLLGLLVVKGPERWWLLLATILAIILSWGRNCMGINEWFFNNMPLYNKFRTPSMSLVLANACMVLMSALAVHNIVKQHETASQADTKRVNLFIYISGGITLAVLLIGLMMANSFSYSGSADTQMAAQYGNNWARIQEVLIADRKALFRSDSWRSILFVLLSAVALWLYNNDKLIKKQGWLVAVLAVLAVIDLGGVDRRYLDKDNFTDERAIRLNPSQTDMLLDQQAQANGDVDYRVLDMSTDTYNNSTPSAFHQQIGGYSAAKLRRYQDLIDFYLNQNTVWKHYQTTHSFDNYPVLDMLNARYMVLPMQDGSAQPVRRASALGNAWFVDSVMMVDDANAEIITLDKFNPATTAIVNRKFADKVNITPAHDSLATIVKEQQQPKDLNVCSYKTHSSKPMMAVFSEIYYAPDWFAYIDGEKADYIQADYVLRAMVIPAGDHTVEFRCEAPTQHRLDRITLIFSIVSTLIVAGALFLYYRKREQQDNQSEKKGQPAKKK